MKLLKPTAPIKEERKTILKKGKCSSKKKVSFEPQNAPEIIEDSKTSNTKESVKQNSNNPQEIILAHETENQNPIKNENSDTKISDHIKTTKNEQNKPLSSVIPNQKVNQIVKAKTPAILNKMKSFNSDSSVAAVMLNPIGKVETEETPSSTFHNQAKESDKAITEVTEELEMPKPKKKQVTTSMVYQKMKQFHKKRKEVYKIGGSSKELNKLVPSSALTKSKK